MPPLNPANKVIKCSLNMPVTVHPSLTTRFFVSYASTAPTGLQLVTFAGSIRSNFATSLASLLSTNSSLASVFCQDLSTGGAQGTDSTSVPGTRAGTEAPVQCAVNIPLVINRRYRGGKPKTFWNFGVQADLADVSHWSAAFLSAINTGITNWAAAVLAAGWTGAGALNFVNVSYFTGFTTVTRLQFRARNVPNPRGTPLVDIATFGNAKSLVGSQRRRRSPA